MQKIFYARHRFPPEIIRYAVWLYFCFPLSFRNVEDMLAERGIDVSYETIRRWCLKFGRACAARLRHSRPRADSRWHLDEIFVSMNGRRVYLWRAVDAEGVVLDALVQSRRNKKSARISPSIYKPVQGYNVMAAPRIPIEVDDKTGVWSTDGLPMLYMPRHFFINNHIAVEQALGLESYAAQLYEATFKSAWTWCEYEAKQHSIAGIAVFQHYMLRISQRGWGQFDGSRIDESTGCGEVFLHNSCFILQADEKSRNRKMCYMFTGWFPGALTWVMGGEAGQNDLVCEETQCASEGHEYCIFTVRQAD